MSWKRLTRTLVAILAILWAGPWTLLGLGIGSLGLLAGGHVRRTGRTLEFWGGGVTWFLNLFPLIKGASAVTFGHTILGRSQSHLDAARPHELVHVRQYERWGLFFVPAYVLCWIALWLIRKDPYRGNPFERQAFHEAG
jgi:hypothetical protein